jgi:hypothetical protein
MNCFNIRELQGILKRKFFSDLLDSGDYRILLKDSMVSLRFKLNSSGNIDHDTFTFHKFGINFSNLDKSMLFNAQDSYKHNRTLLVYDNFFLSFFNHYSRWLCGVDDVIRYA